jgi:plastocyanin
MAGNAWSITIVAGEDEASFVPDVYVPPGTASPASLQAQVSDMVSWNNQTDQEHEIWQRNATPPDTQITSQIDAHTSSSPAYIVGGTAPGTVDYYCSIHPTEKGSIDVIQ